MADNDRSRKKAAIKRASAAARASANKLDRRALDELTEIYRSAAYRISETINSYADGAGTLRLEVMRELLGQTEEQLDQFSRLRDQLLEEKQLETATIATNVFRPAAAELNTSLTRLANDAVAQARRFIDADGLQLSDRLWRLDNHAKRVVGESLQSAIVQGHSAAQAARELISRGEDVPASLTQKINGAGAASVGRRASGMLLRGTGNPYQNALRLFRTEINRAHIDAYRNTASTHPDAIGTRFMLSPNHPEVDICDMHARANLYGLGPGVYPFGKSPLPAHPNTLSYEEVVWNDEITDEAKSTKTDRIAWLKDQPTNRQRDILGVRKAWMLREGLLTANMIGTPWNVLKGRLEKRGIEIPPMGGNSTKAAPTANQSDKPWAGGTPQSGWHDAAFAEKSPIYKAIQKHDANFRGIEATNGGAFFSPRQRTIAMNNAYEPGSRRHQATWRHEYGHYIDHDIARVAGLPVMFRSAMNDFKQPMRDEAKDLTNVAGMGRRSKKQRDQLNANRIAAEEASDNLTAITDPQQRRAELSRMAREIDFTLDEIESAIDRDLILPLGTLEGDIRLARIIKAIERRDTYQLMTNMVPDDTGISGYRRKVYGKGMIGSFSDLLGSATRNKLAGQSGWGLGGHSTAYYRRAEHLQYTEVFANYTALLGDNTPFWDKLMDRLMPATTQRYREIISNE